MKCICHRLTRCINLKRSPTRDDNRIYSSCVFYLYSVPSEKITRFRCVFHRNFTTLAPAQFQPIVAQYVQSASNQIEAALDSDFTGTLNGHKFALIKLYVIHTLKKSIIPLLICN